MSTFASVDEVHQQLGSLFSALIADPEIAPRLAGLDSVIQLALRDPDTTITVKAKAAEELAVLPGADKPAPDIVLALPAEQAHQLWLGELNLTHALAAGDLRVKGPVAKVLSLVALSKHTAPKYKAWLDEGFPEPAAAAEPAPAPAEEAAPAEEPPAAEEPAAAEEAAPEAEAADEEPAAAEDAAPKAEAPADEPAAAEDAAPEAEAPAGEPAADESAG